jgi:Protein of unknown function (DUF3363)
MQRDGNNVLYRKDILDVLRQREVRQVGTQLEAQIGKTFVDPIPGVRIDGVYRQAVDLASGRCALIEKSLEFTLVPGGRRWNGIIGRAVSGISHGDGFDWTIGRSAADVEDLPCERRRTAGSSRAQKRSLTLGFARAYPGR